MPRSASIISVPLLLIAVGCAEQQKVIISQMTASMPFRFSNVGEKSVGVWEGDRLVLVYNLGPIDAPKGATTRPTQRHSNYLHPIYGLDGEVLTDDFPADHLHHRGLYWAWPHVKIGDQQVDLWSLRGIRYELVDLKMDDITAESATLRATNNWVAGDKQIMRENVRLTVHAATSDSRAIDLELTWTPTDRPVTLWGAEGKSYGGLALRVAPRKSQTIITTPTTRATTAKQDLVVTKLPWADIVGVFTGASNAAISGVTIFVAPDHPDYPPTWMTRNYGMLAVGWPGVTPRTIAPGESVTCRYRLWIHRGNPSAVEIGKAYDDYRAPKEKK
jgi:hypothetical protein